MRKLAPPLGTVSSEPPRHPRRAALWLTSAGLFALCLHGPPAQAEPRPELLVIVHPGNPITYVSRSFLADVYLKRTTRWDDGELARPVDQRSDSEPRRTFSETVLKRSVDAVKRYWQQRIFSGRELPPPELDGDVAVVLYVSTHRGAIGYVSGSAKIEKTKPVAIR